ncbi:MAG: cadherin repeat domain-containing protein, partial [Erysipelotrichaceae bacterium]|nr:cadherin repeat domain-containing protein [Erysipelotrichaceae bacterium]
MKKIILLFIMMLSIFTVGYAFYDNIMTASLGLSVLDTRDTNPEGSKFVFGTYDGKDVVFELIKHGVDGGTLALSSGGVRRTTLCKGPCKGTTVNYRDTTLYETEHKINQSLNTAAKIAVVRDVFNPSVTEIFTGGTPGTGLNGTFHLGVKYLKDPNITVYDCSSYISETCDTGLPCEKVCTWDCTWLKQSSYIIPSVANVSYAPVYSTIHPSLTTWNYWDSTQSHEPYVPYVIRPAVILDTTKIAFALEIGLPDHTLHAIDTSNKNATLKLRIKDSTLSAPMINSKTSSYAKGDIIKVAYSNAIAGQHISALLYDNIGNIVYYQNYDALSANGTLEIDTTHFQIGDSFQIKFINEIDTGNQQPNGVSNFSSGTYEITIVPPHEITYIKTPQAGATHGDYEFSKNVNGNDVIGKISLNPTGVLPITYEIVSDGDRSYDNFEIDGLNSDGASSATSLNVKIKSGAPDLVNGGLKVGTYQFCINSVDANGNPVTPTSDSKVCTSFTVEKTNLTVAFNDPNQTKKSINNASTSWYETATATPSNDAKITYTKVGGDIGMINIDPDTGAITYNGGNAFGKVKIRATVDDDPSTGNDNYNPSFVEKEIVIYREVDGVITPDPASGDTTIPTFSANDTNIKTGGTIGKVQGTLGTPDTVGGSTTTYSYTIKPDPTSDGSLFQVNSSTGVIKANANLGVDTYNFVIIVSDKWSSKEIPVTVNVGKA